MIRHVLTVSTGTLASRILGFTRDAMLAALLGAGAVADAFLVAFQFINVTRRMLAEGALNAALVPGYLRVKERDGGAAAAAFAGRVMGSLTVILLVIALALALLMPLVIALLAPGFSGTPALQMAVNDARLMLPYFAFVGPVTVMMGVLNAEHRFALSSFSPLLFNITLLLVLGVLLFRHVEGQTAAIVVAAAVGIAGLMQMLVLIRRRPHRDGLAFPLRITFNGEMRSFLRKAVPGTLANSAPQFLIVAGAIIASSSPSSVSWLYFANRLIELPLGIVGVAMGTVLVPALTRAVNDADAFELKRAESRGLELAIGLALPATLGLMVLAEMTVRVLFEHGRFTPQDTKATGAALEALALALPAHVLMKALSPAFFARDRTAMPLIAMLAGLAIAVLCAVMFGKPYGATGIGYSIAAGAWCSAAILAIGGVKLFGFSLDSGAQRRLPRIVLAGLLMAGMLWYAESFVAPLVANAGLAAQMTILGGLLAAGLAFYALLLELFGIVNWTQAIDDLRG